MLRTNSALCYSSHPHSHHRNRKTLFPQCRCHCSYCTTRTTATPCRNFRPRNHHSIRTFLSFHCRSHQGSNNPRTNLMGHRNCHLEIHHICSIRKTSFRPRTDRRMASRQRTTLLCFRKLCLRSHLRKRSFLSKYRISRGPTSTLRTMERFECNFRPRNLHHKSSSLCRPYKYPPRSLRTTLPDQYSSRPRIRDSSRKSCFRYGKILIDNARTKARRLSLIPSRNVALQTHRYNNMFHLRKRPIHIRNLLYNPCIVEQSRLLVRVSKRHSPLCLESNTNATQLVNPSLCLSRNPSDR
mmetsp:Transcript_25791/g.37757  ORF Transcript_25791/g.37757 Transcript_25791/m.37757 type:complete len:297 (-) Transcript_25791:623-1513(-)